MKNIFLLLVVACSAKQVTAQNNLDSLYKVWQDDGLPDSIRVKAYDDYIWDGFVYSNPDSAFILAKRLLEYGERKDFSKAKTLAYNIQGVSFWLKGNYPRALDCYKQGLKIVEQMGNKGGIAVSLNNIGLIYASQGDYLKALD
ncbi:MAG: tetratricopeptide repeat protein, partial [Flavobacteriales bacterium]